MPVSCSLSVMHTHTLAKSLAALAISLTALVGSAATSHATDTVNLTELRTVDGTDYPVCVEEDCSDQPGQIGLWEDKPSGNWYLSLGEDLSLLVVDDTVS